MQGSAEGVVGAAQEQAAAAQQTLLEVWNLVVNLVSQWGLKVVGAIVLLFIGRMVAGWARRGVRRALTLAEVEPTLIPYITGLVYYTLFAVILVAVLGIVGVQTASFLAVFGAAGLAVGLALQGTLSNFAAGVMLLLFRPFHVGDFIDAGGTAGTVAAIGMFTTELNTPDNVRIVIPNSQIYGRTIKNFAANETRRNDLVMGISYNDDIGKAIATIKRVLDSDDRVLADPEPFIGVGELADSSVNLLVRPWCKKEDFWGLKTELLRTLKEELEAAGCSIPYPHVQMIGAS
jgi:small conductance mechanosensitive channel